MPSTFFGFEIGTRALQANQVALDVISNNIANINTPGYSRQVVTLDETAPDKLPYDLTATSGELGTGVTVASVSRVRDAYIDNRVWTATSQQAASSAINGTLNNVQTAYGEPSTTGIGQQMTNLFNSFSDLAANPESGAIRTTVRDNADSLVTAFHSVTAAISAITPQLKAQISSAVLSVNTLATQIANLNKEITLSQSAGNQPNDLMDQRGQMIDQLSSYVNVQVVSQNNPSTGLANGQVNINIGGFALVQDTTANALPSTPSTANNTIALTSATGSTVALNGGQLYGLIKSTALVAGYQSDLDNLAYNVVNAVNNIHQSGYALDGTTNNAFFTPLTSATGAADAINVASGVEADVNKIAAAAPPVPPATFAAGNGDTATSLAALVSTPVIGNASLNSYYNTKVTAIGADTQLYQNQSDTQTQIVSQLQAQQSSVSGVNLDEELTNMLKYQTAYQAAAKVISTADSCLQTIITSLGAPVTG